MDLNISSILDCVASDLFDSAGCYQSTDSYVFSPLSLLYAGALLYLGSNGPTRDNLNSTLHFRNAFGPNSDIVTVKSLFRNTAEFMDITQLTTPGRNETPIPVKSATAIALVNGVFFDKSLTIKKSYEEDLDKNLHAKAANVDFVKRSPQALNMINNWITVNTFGKIKNLLAKPAVTPDSKLVLVNTLYFRAAWNMHFPKVVPETDTQPFHRIDGNSSKVVMMYARRAIPYAEDAAMDVQYIEIPYVDDFYMAIILPRTRDGIRNLERGFTKDTLRNLRAKVPMLKAGNQRLVNIRLPRFKVEGTFDLTRLLAKTGVTLALGPNADFSNMVENGNPTLSASYHKVYIDVDEWGTQAAAQSTESLLMKGASAYSSWVPDYAPVNFTADHPFIFAVQHRPTESILFLGRAENL